MGQPFPNGIMLFGTGPVRGRHRIKRSSMRLKWVPIVLDGCPVGDSPPRPNVHCGQREPSAPRANQAGMRYAGIAKRRERVENCSALFALY
jgi:hypothetical protein